MRGSSLSKRLRRAAAGQDLAQIKALLRDGADVNDRSKNGRTALHTVVSSYHRSKGTLDCVRCILEAKADPNVSDCDGWRPIHSACEWGKVQCFQLLLEHKATVVNCADNQGWTPLYYAASQKVSVNFLKLILDTGVDVNAIIEEENGGEKTALGRWCRYWDDEDPTENDVLGFHALLDAGADPRLVSVIPAALQSILRSRAAARRAAISVCAALRYRMGRDMATMVAKMVWSTRRDQEEWWWGGIKKV
jgi:ankyrin repeat protein